ncbi:hypothetical protein [Niastella yeongjuensis]|uniref:hypothetical protein n=1 Tax=Niastella yeongjuensis TaxID=354355 RepID=UPI0008D058F8|nr:hypothetical protein [Niastella yeongjuensis]SEP36812.1 hypothetical protein SAMN05660816_05510 [Niastella yeongjuensis]
MKKTEVQKAEIEKKRIIEFAASMGIKLTVQNRPSEKRPIPEKYRGVAHNVSPTES